MTKICKTCGAEKDVLEFYADHNTKDRLKPECKTCHNKRSKAWRKANPEKRKAIASRWHKKHREKATAQHRKWRENNRERDNELSRKCKRDPYLYRERRRRYEKKNMATPEGKLKKRFSSYIRDSLIGGKGGRHWESLVGYTASCLKAHLEKKFETWMSWENYGMPKNGEKTWHIDHIIPRASFVYTSPEDEEFKKCWALNNLQPLEAIKNIKKGKKQGGIYHEHS